MRLKVFVTLAAVLGAVALAQPATGAQSQALVGRWQTMRTCQGLVLALKKFGLAPLAPVVVGDYFPNQQPAALAKKKNLCQGAKPQQHSHFFRATGSSDRSTSMLSRLTTGTTVRMDPRWRSAIRTSEARSVFASKARRSCSRHS